jgi:signal peptidase I
MLFGLLPGGRSLVRPATDRVPPHRRALVAQPRQRSKRWANSTRFLLDAMLGATLMVLVHVFVIQVSVVKGSSMEPCLQDGDRLVVDRVSYTMTEVGRGDVVVLRYPRNHSLDFVKRVVALPGDRVEMHDGTLYVNGAASDAYGCIHDHQELDELIVPDGSYFVLGDNRPISCDSRDFGLVPQDLLKGRVRARFWPLATATVF